MSVESYEAAAVAHCDALSSRSGSISSASSVEAPDVPPSVAYQRRIFEHTNTQYLRAKDRLVKQSLRKSRAAGTADTTTLSKPDSHTSNASSEF